MQCTDYCGIIINIFLAQLQKTAKKPEKTQDKAVHQQRRHSLHSQKNYVVSPQQDDTITTTTMHAFFHSNTIHTIIFYVMLIGINIFAILTFFISILVFYSEKIVFREE